MDKRLLHLENAPVRRHAEILPLPIKPARREIVCAALAKTLRPHLTRLHVQNHSSDPVSGKNVSFGLIRFANIDPLIQVAQALARLEPVPGQRIHLCIYHSRHPLLVRSSIERTLDRLLNRKDPQAIFNDPLIRQALADHPEDDHLFIVLATAVAEVGRDHDYDWAVIEPSSMRSILQLLGRLRRHRPEAYPHTNLLLLDCNIRRLVNGSDEHPAFVQPGFESKTFRLRSHHLSKLLTAQQVKVLDASSRIRERGEDVFSPKGNLVDLEHARLRELMQVDVPSGQKPFCLPTPLWWTTEASLSGYMQRHDPFRRDETGRQRYALLPEQDGEIRLYRLDDDKPVDTNNLLRQISVDTAPGVSFWGAVDYAGDLADLSERMGEESRACAMRFGALYLPLAQAEHGRRVDGEWRYHPAMGFWR